MVSREDVLGCYKYILGRAPESDDVVRSRLSVATLTELRSQFIGSSEFQRSLPGGRPVDDSLFPPQSGRPTGWTVIARRHNSSSYWTVSGWSGRSSGGRSHTGPS